MLNMKSAGKSHGWSVLAVVLAATVFLLAPHDVFAIAFGVQARAHADFSRIFTGLPDEQDDSSLLTATQEISASAITSLISASAFARFGYNSVTVQTVGELPPADPNNNQHVGGFATSRWATDFIIAGGTGSDVVTFVGTFHGFFSAGQGFRSGAVGLSNSDLTAVFNPEGNAQPAGPDGLGAGDFLPPCCRDSFVRNVPGGVEFGGSIPLSVPFAYNEVFPLSGILYITGATCCGTMFNTATFTLSDIILPDGATISRVPEPSALLLLASGLAALIGFGRKKEI